MTKAYISEYARGTLDPRTFLPSGEEPAVATQVVDYTAAHAESATFNVKTRFIRVHVDSIASFRVAAAPVAVTTDPRMAANATEYFGLPAPAGEVGSGLKISFVTNT